MEVIRGVNRYPFKFIKGWEMKKLYWIIGFLILLVVLLFLVPGRKQYVVLVSLDAFRWDYPSLYETPNLDMIAREGVSAESLVPSYPTKTFPNHYAIATGLYPDHNGLIDNTFYAPDLDKVYRMGDREMVENGDFYFGEPVWVTAHRNGLVTASMFWVGSEAPVQGIQPDHWSRYDGSIPYEARIDSVINWLSLPEGERPRFITLYFDEPDGISHDFGPVSHETDSVVQYLDVIIGDLKTRIENLPVHRRVNLIVLSDHGMGEIDNERTVNLWEVLPTEYIEKYYGGNPVYQVDAVDQYIDSVLAIIDRTPGVKGWRKEDLPLHYHYGTSPRIPEIIVEADSSWSIVWVPREGYTMRGKGAHGYDPSNRDMHSIFYAVGPSFREGYLSPSFNNVDLYNIICKVLGIEPSPNDGDPRIIKRLLK